MLEYIAETNLLAEFIQSIKGEREVYPMGRHLIYVPTSENVTRVKRGTILKTEHTHVILQNTNYWCKRASWC